MVSDDGHDAWRQLTALERFLLRCDRNGGEMVFRVNLHFDGLLDAQRLQRAVDEALKLHPLLCSRVGNGTHWFSLDDGTTLETEHGQAMPHPSERALVKRCIESEAGIAVHLATSSDRQSLLGFDFHHVCTDGQGGGQFARDVLKAYAGSPSSRDASQAEADLSKLVQRGAPLRRQSVQPLTPREKLRDLMVTIRGRNVRWSSRETAAQTSPPLLATTFLSAAETLSIHDSVRRRGYTLNDVALAASIIAIAKMNAKSKPNEYVSIMNPVSLRGWEDRRMSAANRFGFAFVRRRVRDLAHPHALLDSVVDQMRYVRDRYVSAELMEGVKIAETVPGMLSAIERSGRFVATANFTCMSNSYPGRRVGFRQNGGVWTIDGAPLTKVSGYGPLPPKVPLSLALCDAGAIISLNVRGRLGMLSNQHVQHCVDGWRDAILELAR